MTVSGPPAGPAGVTGQCPLPFALVLICNNGDLTGSEESLARCGSNLRVGLSF